MTMFIIFGWLVGGFALCLAFRAYTRYQRNRAVKKMVDSWNWEANRDDFWGDDPDG